MKEILLFLGSGVSYKSGLPNLTDITNSILKDQWFKHTDELFYRGVHPSPYFHQEDITPKLQEFLNIVKGYSDDYLVKRRGWGTNYEDLFYICQQISDNEKHEFDNPAIFSFIRYIKKKTKHLYQNSINGTKEINLSSLASDSLVLIGCVVHHALSTNKDPNGFDLIYQLSISKIKFDIVTLNHDTLLERVMAKHGIEFVDGFGEKQGDIRWFEPQRYDNNSDKTILFKLHGSINWHRFREEITINGRPLSQDRYGQPLHHNSPLYKNEKGKYLIPLNHSPIFLTGTYNKLSDYNFNIFRIINNKFEDSLWNHNFMIMSGYGWNDHGINGRLFEWLLSSMDKRLILLHENPEEIKRNSKSAMRHRYDTLVKEGRLIPVEKWFSDIKIDELLPLLEKSNFP
jgi:hypothetical protein